MTKYLDANGLLYLWSKIKSLIPTKVSDLNNDSNFITQDQVPDGATASSTSPKMNGVASVGVEIAFARGDHVHPSDTGKVDTEAGKGLSTNDYTTAEKNKLGGIASNANNYILPDASMSQKGGVLLSTSTSDTSTTKAATPSAVKAAYDLANGKQSPATSLAGYGIIDAYTKSEVDGFLTSALHYKGTKATYSLLPATGNVIGDVWNIAGADVNNGINAGDNVAWNGTGWDVMAGTVDLSAYLQSDDLVAITNAEIDTIAAS